MTKRALPVTTVWEIENWIGKTLIRGVGYTYGEILRKVTTLAKQDLGRTFKRLQFTKEFGKQFDQLVSDSKVIKHWEKTGTVKYMVPMTKEEEEKVEMLLITLDVLKADD